MTQQHHNLLLQYVRESPSVASAYVNVCSAEKSNLPAALDLLAEAIRQLPVTTSQPAPSTVVADQVAAVNNVILAARHAKITKDVLCKAFFELRANKEAYVANNEALIAAIREARAAINSVSHALKVLSDVNVTLKELTPDSVLLLEHAEAKLTNDATLAIKQLAQIVDTAEKTLSSTTHHHHSDLSPGSLNTIR
jgi:hypothetical protein